LRRARTSGVGNPGIKGEVSVFKIGGENDAAGFPKSLKGGVEYGYEEACWGKVS